MKQSIRLYLANGDVVEATCRFCGAPPIGIEDGSVSQRLANNALVDLLRAQSTSLLRPPEHVQVER